MESIITDKLRHLKGWMRPERHLTALQNFPARSRVLKEPYGVALIMSPWNYPFLPEDFGEDNKLEFT